MLRGQEFIDALKIVAPGLKEILGKDFVLVITDREQFLDYYPADTFDLNIQRGNQIPQGDPLRLAMAQGHAQNNNIPKEVFGVPFKARAVPIYDDNGSIMGGIGVGVSMETEASVMELSHHLQNSMQESAKALEQIASTSETINEIEQVLHQHVRAISNAAKQIKSVLAFVQKMAAQTQMLSINASIESARSGESGRGFGIVAQEIGKLSLDSKTTTDQIKTLTDQIEEKINAAINGSENVLKANQDQSIGIQKITATVQELTAISEQLALIAQDL
ncbi:hypothetical protein H1S01_09585 [Heliobacterium chlorum]|uniref:Methyl-accepting transducer domain-containing protein n=1 Tax=Heliobacterium chlorum TaxID=2698 RepID=A0ABR7T5C6_HELCL|nr:methyl-accepting chemotaxis protein [Heliobacterium chlorum]MBC9784761.1 hypothetical protein [Heliobacterium chlorum]